MGNPHPQGGQYPLIGVHGLLLSTRGQFFVADTSCNACNEALVADSAMHSATGHTSAYMFDFVA